MSNLVMLSKPSSSGYIPSVLQRHQNQHSILHVYSADSSATAPVETHRLTTRVGETLHRQRQLSSKAAKIRETLICAGDCVEGARHVGIEFLFAGRVVIRFQVRLRQTCQPPGSAPRLLSAQFKLALGPLSVLILAMPLFSAPRAKASTQNNIFSQ